MSIMTYEEFKQTRVKYPSGPKCFMGSCYQPGYYEGGDERYYCPMCEKHANVAYDYKLYMKKNKDLPISLSRLLTIPVNMSYAANRNKEVTK